MEALTFRRLQSDSEIDRYLKKFEGFVKVKLPYNYSIGSEIVGMFRGDSMIGGYMLVTKPIFRSLMFVPDDVKRENSFFRNDEYEMMEVNGVWLSAAVKSAIDQYRFWTHLVWDVFRSRKKYILLMADLNNANVRNIHSLTNPELLYEGAPSLMPGRTSHANIRVSFTTRWRILQNLPKYYLAYRDRVRRSVRRGRMRQSGLREV